MPAARWLSSSESQSRGDSVCGDRAGMSMQRLCVPGKGWEMSRPTYDSGQFSRGARAGGGRRGLNPAGYMAF